MFNPIAMYSETVEKRFEVALLRGDLRTLVEEFRAEHISQVAIYELFNSFASALRKHGRDSDEDVVLDAMDYIWGWCAPGREWFANSLSDEAIQEYRDSLRDSDGDV